MLPPRVRGYSAGWKKIEDSDAEPPGQPGGFIFYGGRAHLRLQYLGACTQYAQAPAGYCFRVEGLSPHKGLPGSFIPLL